MEQPETDQFVVEERKRIPVAIQADVAVAGGGVAGVAAAVAAARNGAKTVLVETTNCLGGTATATFMSVFHLDYSALHGFAKETVDRLVEMGGALKGAAVVPYDPEAFKTASLEAIEKSGASVLLYTSAVAPLMRDGVAGGLIIENKSGRQAVAAKVTIDCTGDGDIAWRAGAQTIEDNKPVGKKRPMTLLFRVGGIDVDQLEEYVLSHRDEFSPDPKYFQFDRDLDLIRLAGFWSIFDHARRRGEVAENVHYLRITGGIGSISRGMVIVNTTRAYDLQGIDARELTRAEIECRKQMAEIMNVMVKYIPGFERAYIIDTSSYIGIRESRRILGEYVLVSDDIAEDRQWEDAVARAYTAITPGTPTHSPSGGEGGPGHAYYREQISPIRSHSIPYRCLIPKGIDGLLVAGRCISVSDEAFESCRGQATCMYLGYAGGAAAALAACANTPVREIDPSRLRSILEEQGQQTGRPEIDKGE
jgi:glycine/D-amino acid oxidase-like deaminating enzyme